VDDRVRPRRQAVRDRIGDDGAVSAVRRRTSAQPSTRPSRSKSAGRDPQNRRTRGDRPFPAEPRLADLATPPLQLRSRSLDCHHRQDARFCDERNPERAPCLPRKAPASKCKLFCSARIRASAIADGRLAQGTKRGGTRASRRRPPLPMHDCRARTAISARLLDSRTGRSLQRSESAGADFFLWPDPAEMWVLRDGGPGVRITIAQRTGGGATPRPASTEDELSQMGCSMSFAISPG